MLSTHDTTNWPGWWEKEAGTIDEQLFIRKCGQHRIDYLNIKDKLFDPSRSVYGRLRWRDDLDSPDKFLWQLGRPKEELADLLDLYLNSFCEKEKLWNLLGLPGQMREKYDHQLLESALRLVLDSRAIFCVQNILDYLFLGEDTLPGDPYSYRFNIPGRISEKNWSLVLPFSLEELLADPVTARIKEMIRFSGRINNKVLSA
jgi:4-alpha-glucanotransferase